MNESQTVGPEDAPKDVHLVMLGAHICRDASGNLKKLRQVSESSHFKASTENLLERSASLIPSFEAASFMESKPDFIRS